MHKDQSQEDLGSAPSIRLSTLKAMKVIILLGSPARSSANFRLGRGRDGPKRFLGQFEGILQTDGYAAYDQIGGPRMVHAACWAHARRQFFEALQLNPRDRLQLRLWRRWTDCLPSTRKLAAKR